MRGEGEPQFKDQRGNPVQSNEVSKQSDGESKQNIPTTSDFPLIYDNKRVGYGAISRGTKCYALYLVPDDKVVELRVVDNAEALKAVQIEENLLGVFGQSKLMFNIVGGGMRNIKGGWPQTINEAKFVEGIKLRGGKRALVVCFKSPSFSHEKLTMLGYQHLNYSEEFVPMTFICDTTGKNTSLPKMKADRIIYELVSCHAVEIISVNHPHLSNTQTFYLVLGHNWQYNRGRHGREV